MTQFERNTLSISPEDAEIFNFYVVIYILHFPRTFYVFCASHAKKFKERVKIPTLISGKNSCTSGLSARLKIKDGKGQQDVFFIALINNR